MKMKIAVPMLLAAAIIGIPAAQASDNETIFLNAQGKLVIPHLRLGNEIYYVILQRTNPNSYNFDLNAHTVTKITPQPGDDWATSAEIVGDWTFPDMPGVSLGIFGNGNYSVVTPADEDCPAGTESGTWTHDEETGVFFTVAVSDTNLDCGLSHPDGALRLKRNGTNLTAVVNEVEDGAQVTAEIALVRQ